MPTCCGRLRAEVEPSPSWPQALAPQAPQRAVGAQGDGVAPSGAHAPPGRRRADLDRREPVGEVTLAQLAAGVVPPPPERAVGAHAEGVLLAGGDAHPPRVEVERGEAVERGAVAQLADVVAAPAPRALAAGRGQRAPGRAASAPTARRSARTCAWRVDDRCARASDALPCGIRRGQRTRRRATDGAGTLRDARRCRIDVVQVGRRSWLASPLSDVTGPSHLGRAAFRPQGAGPVGWSVGQRSSNSRWWLRSPVRSTNISRVSKHHSPSTRWKVSW